MSPPNSCRHYRRNSLGDARRKESLRDDGIAPIRTSDSSNPHIEVKFKKTDEKENVNGLRSTLKV
jgi:hypothetical protein